MIIRPTCSVLCKSKSLTIAPIYLKISAMECEIFWAFLILGTMSTMVSRPILKNLFTFAYKFYNIELRVANYTGGGGGASHGWLTIRWYKNLLPKVRPRDVAVMYL